MIVCKRTEKVLANFFNFIHYSQNLLEIQILFDWPSERRVVQYHFDQ